MKGFVLPVVKENWVRGRERRGVGECDLVRRRRHGSKKKKKLQKFPTYGH